MKEEFLWRVILVKHLKAIVALATIIEIIIRKIKTMLDENELSTKKILKVMRIIIISNIRRIIKIFFVLIEI